MSGNSHFTVALHILTWMASPVWKDEMATSDQIALSVNTNPVFIRRILGLLNKAHLVTVQRGTGAGWQLAHAPEQITLLAVYEAVEHGPLFEMHHGQPNQRCKIGCGIQSALGRFYDDAEVAMKRKLAETTIADVFAETQIQASRASSIATVANT